MSIQIRQIRAIQIQNDILKYLNEHGPTNRTTLCIELGLPRSTCYDNLLVLLKEGKVIKKSSINGKRGRPIVLWSVNHEEY